MIVMILFSLCSAAASVIPSVMNQALGTGKGLVMRMCKSYCGSKGSGGGWPGEGIECYCPPCSRTALWSKFPEDGTGKPP